MVVQSLISLITITKNKCVEMYIYSYSFTKLNLAEYQENYRSHCHPLSPPLKHSAFLESLKPSIYSKDSKHKAQFHKTLNTFGKNKEKKNFNHAGTVLFMLKTK